MPNLPQPSDVPSTHESAIGGIEPPSGGVEARLTKVETDITAIKIDVAVIKATGATKADLAEAKVTIIFWHATIVILGQVLPSVVKLFTP